MADSSDLNLDAPSDLQDLPDLSMELIPPQEGTYPDRASLLAAVQAHGKAHGYNIVVKSSSTPTEKKPGRVAKVWLRCDRGGQYRPRNGLTEETRKRRRTSRLMDCPFMLVAAGHPGIWTLTVLNPSHNHGPIVEKPRQNPHPKAKKGQVTATPYDWPHDATFTPFTTALFVHQADTWRIKDTTLRLHSSLFLSYSDYLMLSAQPAFLCIIPVKGTALTSRASPIGKLSAQKSTRLA
ncbi:isochorismatase hydrolase [Histoplasma capsulatum]|uniref:Isochorismatase hydrolase n=1 Tax=Ajellomyces capsulatus TaxID=5037 RepID=A0A8A1MHB0_AJECA|nr:isochorismatase hydrolase [Histoplasma capsulatum]